METIFSPATAPRQTEPRSGQQSFHLSPDLLLQIYELLQGERDMVRVYSHTLQCHLSFVNPERQNPELLQNGDPVYTTRELAYVLSLSREDLIRFHYLKTRLVG
ncbi:MAG: hypothetical protein Kow0037_27260 [Calditrichia bacterium]